MNKMKVEQFWKHPGRYVLGLFFGVVAFCTLFTFMPMWFNRVCTILLIVVLIKKNVKFESNKKRNKRARKSNVQ